MRNEPRGWIALHRSILDHYLWEERPFSKGQAWVDLLLLANHEDRKIMNAGQIMTYKRGTVSRSLLSLGERWGWDRKKVRRFMSVLEADGMLAVNTTTHGTTITIVNYGLFQDRGTTDGATVTPTAPQQEEQPLPTNNNDNNDNNDNKRKRRPPFKAPELDEVSAYCEERQNGISAEAFIDYYQARGWELKPGQKMKDWRSAVRTWERHAQKWEKKGGVDNVPGQREGYGKVEDIFT